MPATRPCSRRWQGRTSGGDAENVAYRLRRALDLLGRDAVWEPELRAALAVGQALEA